MNNIVEADYTIVQDRTLPVIISEIKIIEQHVSKTAMEGAIQIGQRLQEAKEQVGHGNFETWCQENLNYTRRTAENFMRISREYGGENGLLANAKISSHFSISNALSLLKVPEEDREKFVEEHPVEDMTNKDLEEEIRKLKEEKATLEEEVANVAKDRSEIHGQLAEAEAEVQRLKGMLAVKADEPKADPEELEKLQAKLEKAEQKAAKAKEELKKEKEERQEAIDKEVEAQREEMAKQTKKSIAGLQDEIEKLKSREKKAGNETLLRFKILVDQLQEAFRQAGECILDEEDQEQADKMNAALKAVLKKMEEDL